MASTQTYAHYQDTGSGVSAMDFDSHEADLPRTKIYHGMDIIVSPSSGKFNRIGRVQSWAPQTRTRQAVHKYELSSATFGRPVDLIPGRAEGYSISMSRTEVWGQEVEKVFGLTPDSSLFADLMDQRWPMTLVEYLYRGSSSENAAYLYSQWTYPNCWITSYGESEYSAEGDGVIMVNLEIMHLPRQLSNYNPSLVTVNK